eukprot:TRINITY_DN17562_c0_g1_i2.p1 TRINITY_DN17562_c0_g1~~TRINITY_DN17562_c0_g1_i2.p1  ORF type:complete len:492 (+),score=131.57 TRINITY_DN17562_c0_g1_i2:248-1723(+)
MRVAVESLLHNRIVTAQYFCTKRLPASVTDIQPNSKLTSNNILQRTSRFIPKWFWVLLTTLIGFASYSYRSDVLCSLYFLFNLVLVVFLANESERDLSSELKSGLRGCPWTPNLLEKVVSKDLPKFQKKTKQLQEIQNESDYEYKSLVSSKFYLLGVVLLLLVFGISGLFWITIPCLFLLLLTYYFKPSFAFTKQKKDMNHIWESIEVPDIIPPKVQKIELKELKKEPSLTDEEIAVLLSPLPSEIQPQFQQFLKKEIQIEVSQKKAIFKYVTDKNLKKQWSQLLFGSQPSQTAPVNDVDGNRDKKEKKKGNQEDKENRRKKIFEAHENSTLENETGLPHLIKMRRFLQSPSEQYVSPDEICVHLAFEAIETIEDLITNPSEKELLLSKPLLENHLHNLKLDCYLQFALEYHLGLYALYAAQIKWYVPNLIDDNKHLDMRDHYMHGIEHSYALHLTSEGERLIKEDIIYLLFSIKPNLSNHLKSLPLNKPS